MKKKPPRYEHEEAPRKKGRGAHHHTFLKVVLFIN